MKTTTAYLTRHEYFAMLNEAAHLVYAKEMTLAEFSAYGKQIWAVTIK